MPHWIERFIRMFSPRCRKGCCDIRVYDGLRGGCLASDCPWRFRRRKVNWDWTDHYGG